MRYYIGVDLGTSSVKLILMDAAGNVIKSVSRTYPVYYPHPGWSEQNPVDWFLQAIIGLAELLDGVDRANVCGMSFGGQMHGLVALDKDNRVIRPAILWNDGRTTKEVDYLNNVIGKRRLSELTGNIAFAGFTAPKLLWMRENEPENFRRIAKIMLPKDYLAYRLTGVHSTDPSDASGMLLFDVKNRCWSEEMIEICGIRKDMLAKVYESYEPIGKLRREIADELGLGDVVVAAGAGDNAAAAVGTGTVGQGKCNISLGTSGTVFIPCASFTVDPQNALHAFAHADGAYHLMGCMLSAASCGKWWIEDILKTGDYAAEQSDLPADGRNDVYFLPYLMGERSPHNDADARGMFFGMRMDTTRAELTQAVYEGVTFGLRDSLEVAKAMGILPASTRLCGGGAKSKLWRQMAADILNLDIEILEAEEGPGMGGAMLAAVACGEYANVAEAAKAIVKVREVMHPRPEAAARYEARYRFYTKLYPAEKALFAEMRG